MRLNSGSPRLYAGVVPLPRTDAGNPARRYLEKILEHLSASMFYNCMTFFLPRLRGSPCLLPSTP
ncbi:hypothetical protein DENIT_90012 [Pseudomonas veronii]|nr:hypothetical protein DENIT_90012 [Pseudomonas veronii]